MTRQIILECDDADYDTIQNEIARFQASSHKAFGETILPEGESNLAGSIVAECIRDLVEYRGAWEANHP